MGAAAARGLTQRADEHGLGLIDPASGVAALERTLNTGKPQIAVLPADWSRLAASHHNPPFLSRMAPGKRGPRSEDSQASRNGWLRHLRNVSSGQQRELLLVLVQQEAARVLGSEPERLPDRQTGFFELGMDSLMAVELRNRLQANLGGIALSSTVIFDHPTVEALASHLADRMLNPTAADPQERPVELDQLGVEELLQLMDAKSSRLLGRKGAT
ncbi:MAG: phosphopantetheine-binding protein [Gemmataceae bacterium]